MVAGAAEVVSARVGVAEGVADLVEVADDDALLADAFVDELGAPAAARAEKEGASGSGVAEVPGSASMQPARLTSTRPDSPRRRPRPLIPPLNMATAASVTRRTNTAVMFRDYARTRDREHDSPGSPGITPSP